MIHVVLFHDSGGFQSSILSVITYMNEGGSKLSNDAYCALIPPTNLKNKKILICKIYPKHPVYSNGSVTPQDIICDIETVSCRTISIFKQHSTLVGNALISLY